MGKGDKQKILKEEGENILSKISNHEYVCLLDETGIQLSSIEFANNLLKWRDQITKPIVFIIGGAYGVSNDVKNRADFVLSFSKMTFTHQIIRIFLLEQIYRSSCIIMGNKGYHH